MDTKIRCILVDDELPGLDYLKTLCIGIPFVEVVRTFNRSEKFLEEKDKLAFDLCLLDIEMPAVNGMELARRIGKPVIFTTAYKGYAAEAFDINAIDYLVKPIHNARFRQAMDKAKAYFEATKSAPAALLNTDKGKAIIDFANVAVITTSPTDPRDKHLLYKNGQELTIKNYSFEALSEYTGGAGMYRVNKRQMIAIALVRIYTQTLITLTIQGKSVGIPLSSRYRPAFLEAIEI